MSRPGTTMSIGDAAQPSEGPGQPDVQTVGGLWPTTNVAAQAGNMDPGRAAVIALGAGTAGTGRVDLPTLRITASGWARGNASHSCDHSGT